MYLHMPMSQAAASQRVVVVVLTCSSPGIKSCSLMASMHWWPSTI